RSLCKNDGNSWGEAYQRERQSRFTFNRNPIGLTFCPINVASWSLNYLFVFLVVFLSDFLSLDGFSVVSLLISFFTALFLACRFVFRVSRVSMAISSESTMRI